MEDKIIVPVPHCRGSLVVRKTNDAEYPGVRVSFLSDDEQYERAIIIIEAPVCGKNGEINTYYYGNPDSDSWTDKHDMLIRGNN